MMNLLRYGTKDTNKLWTENNAGLSVPTDEQNLRQKIVYGLGMGAVSAVFALGGLMPNFAYAQDAGEDTGVSGEPDPEDLERLLLHNISERDGEAVDYVEMGTLGWNIGEQYATELVPGFEELQGDERNRAIAEVTTGLMLYNAARSEEERDRFSEGSAGWNYWDARMRGQLDDSIMVIDQARIDPLVQPALDALKLAYDAALAERDSYFGWVDRWEIDPRKEKEKQGWFNAETLRLKLFNQMQSLTVGAIQLVPTAVAGSDTIPGDLEGAFKPADKPVMVPGVDEYLSFVDSGYVLTPSITEDAVAEDVSAGDGERWVLPPLNDFERQRFAFAGGYQHIRENGALPIVGNGAFLEGGLRIPTSDNGSVYLDADRISLSHLELGDAGDVTVLDMDLSAAYGWNLGNVTTLTAGGRLQARANAVDYAGKQDTTGRAIPAVEVGLRSESEAGRARVAVSGGFGGGSDAQEIIGLGLSAEATAHAGPVDLTVFGSADYYRSTAELEDGAQLNTSSSAATVGGAVDVFPTRARNFSVGLESGLTGLQGPAAEKVTPSVELLGKLGFRI